MADAAHSILDRLAGEWSGMEDVTATQWTKGGTARAQVKATRLAGGFLQQDYVQTRDGAVTFSSHNLIAVTEGKFRLWQFDSFGFPPVAPAEGQMVGDTLVFTKTTPRGSQRLTYRFEAPNSYRLDVEFSAQGPDGPWVTMVAGVYTGESGTDASTERRAG